VQLMYTVLRLCCTQQLTHLLRWRPPTSTTYAAERLDVAVANTAMTITNSTELLPGELSCKMKQVLKRLFMPIRMGGDGLHNARQLCEAAYTASFASSQPRICEIAKCRNNVLNETDSVSEYRAAVRLLKEKMTTQVKRLTRSGCRRRLSMS